MNQDELKRRLAGLSPEKRALLFEKLKRESGEADGAAVARKRKAVEIPAVARDGEDYPLSFAQQRLWFLYQYDPESAEYNIPQGFRLRGDLDLGLLRRSLTALVARHEVLRTSFRQVETEPRQVIAPAPDPTDPPDLDAGFALPVEDLTTTPDPEAAALSQASADAQVPFDLTRGPLMRARLYRLGAEDHLLYLNVHHILSDGWSQGIFLAELGAFYAAFSEGREPELGELPVQYLDFALWQRDHLQGEVLAEHVESWRRRLGDVPALELPTDRPRPAQRTHEGVAFPFELSPELSRRVRELASAAGATPFITLLAAFRALLARYSGQGDVGVGTLIANRRRREAEGLIGFFANTLVLRTDASDDPSFRELIARERETALDAYGHQDLPFEKLVEELSPPRDLSRTPLFQTMFILQNAPGAAGDEGAGALELPGLEIAPVGIDSRTSKFDLSLYMTDATEREGRFTGFFEYNVDLFDRSTIERMTEHFLRLLDGAVNAPDRRLSELTILTADERTTLIEAWNDTAAELPAEATIHGLVFERAAQDPSAEAVVFGDERLTYGELAEQAGALGAHLRGLGAGPETLVGVFLERSLDMLVAVLGVMASGAAYVPLDPEYPEDRIGYVVESSGLPLLVIQADLEEKLPEVAKSRRLVRIDADREEIAAAAPAGDLLDATASAGPESLAYVIYTSGSTGKPKGVQVAHRSVVNFLRSMATAPGFGAGDRLLAVTTLSFDIAGLELYLPLVTGGTVVIAARETAQAGELLLERTTSAGATVMQATPATWRLLLDAGWEGPPPAKILCGGEALPRDLADRLLAALAKGDGGELWNMYGPTETTIWSAVLRVTAGAEAVPVGGPIANTALYVLDPALEPVPVGVPGELFIGGHGLARGYRDRPALTAERFVPDPFTEAAPVEPGGRMYRTGDLVRWRPDGTLAFMGRIDHQVKVRGFRIELGEIESVLVGHEAVEQAVVIVREDRPGDKRLAAYLVASDPEQAPTVGALRAYLKERLPDYMVPPIFIVLDTMPLTPNGKVDRRSLPAPDRNRPELGEEYVAPRNPTEAALVEIWGRVLEIERIGVNDDFFDLGGDSLMVIKVVSQANKAGLGVTTKQVFQNRTVAELAAVAGTSEIVAEQGPVTGDTPCTPAQLHFLELSHPNPGWHSLGTLLELDTAVDVDAVEEAMRLLLAQHDNLRVRLAETPGADGVPRMVTDPEPPETGGVELHRIDLAGLDEAEQQVRIRDTVFDLTRSFDLTGGPLFKGAYLDRGPGREKLVFLITHFFAADIGSWHTLLDDFDTYYRALAAGETPTRQPKTTAAKQWAERLAERAASEAMREELPFWLSDERRRATALPKDHPEGANEFRSARSVQSRFTVEETRALLIDIPRKYKVQIDGLLLTAMLHGFRGWTGGETFLVDLLGHGREALYDDTDLTRTVGWLNTIFPVALSVADRDGLEASLRAVNQQLRDIPNGGIGYGILRYLARDEEIAEQMRSMPEPDVFFNYFGPDNAEQLHTFRKADGWGGYVLDNTTTRLRPLAVGIYIQHDRMLIKWEYSTQVHEEATIRRVVDRAEEVLRHFLAEVGVAARKDAELPADQPAGALA